MAEIHRKKCPRCKSLFLVSLPRRKGEETEVGECSTPWCYALAHYTAEDWQGKARMARTRVAAGVATDAFDSEALRRFP